MNSESCNVFVLFNSIGFKAESTSMGINLSFWVISQLCKDIMRPFLFFSAF